MLRVILASLVLSVLITQTTLAQISISPKEADERSFNFEIQAGQEASATLEITNLLDKETIVKIFAVDATQSRDGALAFTTLASTQKTIGLWAKSTEEKIQIGQGATREVEFKIKVPTTASPGTYIGAIAAQEISEQDEKNSNQQVSISSRVVSKIYIKVPGEIVHQYKWQDLKVSGNEQKTVALTLENSGNSLVTVEGEVSIVNMFTGKQSIIKSSETNIFAREKKEIFIPWKNPPSFGWVKIKGQFSFGKYDFLSRKAIDKKIESKEITIFLVPQTFKIAFILLLTFIASYLFFHHYHRRQQKKNSVEYKVAKGESLESIANKFKINWQELAKINKIQAPYTVRANDILLIPHANQKTK